MDNDYPLNSRYQRQGLFQPLGSEGDRRLRGRRILIVGCGALGSHLAAYMARAGVGHLRLVDRDLVEWSNLHRQVEFTEDDARQRAPKSTALAHHLRQANSEIEIESAVKDFNARNAISLARGCDLVLDGSDNLPTRFLINEVSLAEKIAWIYGGAIGEEAHAILFIPGRGPCLRCLLDELPPAGEMATCDTAGILGPAAGAAASFQAALALQYLSHPDEAAAQAGRWVRLRLWNLDATTAQVGVDPQCRTCGQGVYEFLQASQAGEAQKLCGRGAVQILPERTSPAELDLPRLARRLQSLGGVEMKKLLVRFTPAGSPSTITVFTDGRAIIDGIEDLGQARALYDRFIGR